MVTIAILRTLLLGVNVMVLVLTTITGRSLR